MRMLFQLSFLFIAVFLTSCGGGGTEWNQKLTITVEIDGKEYVGSGVSKVRITRAGKLAQESRGNSVNEDIKGEAVVVDLGEHGYLFALWDYQNPGGWARSLGKRPKTPSDSGEAVDQNISYHQSLNGQKILNPGKIPTDEGEYPILVAFKDVKNPRTIEVFRESFYLKARGRNASIFNPKSFSRFFGSTARVKSIAFEITDEPVTQGKLTTVLGEKYFEEWHKSKRSYGSTADCMERANPAFCTLHKGRWVRKFPGDSK